MRMIGEYIRGIPEGRLTSHVAGSMEDCSSVRELQMLLDPDVAGNWVI